MKSQEHPKLNIQQIFGEIFCAAWQHRIAILKLALPFVLIATAILGLFPHILLIFENHILDPDQLRNLNLLEHPSLSNIGAYILYQIPGPALFGWSVLLYLLWAHAFFLIHHQKIEWPFSNQQWLKRYAHLALYGVLYLAFAIIGWTIVMVFEVSPWGELKILMVPVGIALGFFLFYLLLRLSFYEVGIIVGESEPFPFSWRLLRGNLLRVLVLLAAIEIVSLGLLLFVVRIFRFSGGMDQHPASLFFIAFLFTAFYALWTILKAIFKVKVYGALTVVEKPAEKIAPKKPAPKDKKV